MHTRFAQIRFCKIILSIGLCFALLTNPITEVIGESRSFVHFYDDNDAERGFYVHYDSPDYFLNLGVAYNSTKPLLVRGVAFKYNTPQGKGPHNLELWLYDQDWSENWTEAGLTAYISDIPHINGWDWYFFGYWGPLYLIDYFFTVGFIGLDPESDSIAIGADNPSSGHSFYNQNGTNWFTFSEFELIVELEYENVIELALGEVNTGIFTEEDNIDAYQIQLQAGTPYNITLSRTSGTGDIDFRLLENQTITLGNLTQTAGVQYPKSTIYIPLVSKSYYLLVEATPAGAYANYELEINKLPSVSEIFPPPKTITESTTPTTPTNYTLTTKTTTSSSGPIVSRSTQITDEEGQFIHGFTIDLGLFASITLLSLRKRRKRNNSRNRGWERK